MIMPKKNLSGQETGEDDNNFYRLLFFITNYSGIRGYWQKER